MNLRTTDPEPDYWLIPFRPDRRQVDRRKRQVSDMERTQFRALGWSVRYKRTLSKAGDTALAFAIMAVMAAFVASPVVLVLILWVVVK